MQSRKLFFISYVQSYIDYASTLWDLSSDTLIKSLTRTHKRAIKLVLNKSSSLVRDNYKIVGILPIKSKFLYNKGILMHKIINGYAPDYLCEMFTLNSFRHTHKINIPFPHLMLF